MKACLMLLIAAASLAFLSSNVVNLVAPLPEKPGKTVVDERNPERVVCKLETPTGSKLAKKVCRTQRAAQDQHDGARDALDAVQRQRYLKNN